MYPPGHQHPKDYEPTLNDLQWEAEFLAQQLAADRAANPVVPQPVVKPRWTRVLKFFVTVRKFERVFHAQGSPLGGRWVTAVKMAFVTLR
jgi:hypothetical protein